MTDLGPFVGRFHPLLVHFPIGILLLAALLQAVVWWRDVDATQGLRSTTRLVLALGALAAVASAATGYLLGSTGGYSGETYERHLWLGFGVAGTACCAAIFLRLRDRSSSPLWRGGYVVSIVVMVAALVGAGHFGATLTHGEGYLTEQAPAPLRAILARVGMGPAASARAPSPDEARVFATLIQPVLQTRCVSCHGTAKAEGGLRLDTPDGLRKGGNDGPAVVAGRSASSELVRRIWLPASHEDAMPPRGQPPLRPAEASLLRWWIDQGAKFDQKVIDAELTADVLPAIETVLGPIERGGPTLPRAPVPAADPAALAALRRLGASIVVIADGKPFLHVHCTNARATFGDRELTALEPIARQVIWLDLSGTQVTDAGLALVSKLPNLTRLNLSHTSMTGAGLAHIARLERLEYLNLYGTGVTDSAVGQLTTLKNLRTLYVWQTAVTRQGVEGLKRALPRLEVDAGQAPQTTQTRGEARTKN